MIFLEPVRGFDVNRVGNRFVFRMSRHGQKIRTARIQATTPTTWTTATITVSRSLDGVTPFPIESAETLGPGNDRTALIDMASTPYLICQVAIAEGGALNLDILGSFDTEGDIATASAHSLLSSTHTDVSAASPVLGDLIHGNSTPNWARLAGSTSSQRAILVQTGTGSVSAAPSWLADDPLLKGSDVRERVYTHPHGIPSTGTHSLTSGTAWFVYMGRASKAITPKYVRFLLAGLGVGAQTAEVGIFSTPAAPTWGTTQNVSKIVATDTVDDLTTGINNIKGNSSAFATAVSAGTYWYAGIRTAMASGDPSSHRLQADYGSGAILTTAGASALTGAGPWTGVPLSATANGPYLMTTLD